MFGIQVPRTAKEAIEIDKKNGNTHWQDAMKAEISQLFEYETFKDKGYKVFVNGYKKIRVHFVFAVKHDLRHKARLVSGGHMTDPDHSIYSGVVSLRSFCLTLLIAERNSLETIVGNVGNAFLESFTQEKVYFEAGLEFGELAGHSMIIVKALYGLRSSGARFHERFADTLRDMDFLPCQADHKVWMRDCKTHSEYVCVYVDDLMVMSMDPTKFFALLKDKYNYKLKDVGPREYHLGGAFFRNKDRTLVWGTPAFAKKLVTNYELMFGCKPK